jgi:membrane protease YdiL (CAAX protease family)
MHILVYASIGYVFAFLYVKTKRIIVPIIVHMAMNTIVVIGQLSLDPEEIEQMQQQLQMIFAG